MKDFNYQGVEMYGKVSIIMPNYNCERFINETINSVFAQTYTDWELLIVDDCSTDKSVEIIKGYCEKDERVKLFVNAKNRGAAAARNKALREAKGKWIAFLDSDDLWIPQKLEKQIAFMQANRYKYSYTAYEQISEDGNSLNKIVFGPKKITKRKTYRYCYAGCLTVMYDAEAIGVPQIDERIGNGRNDYAIWLKVCHKADCYLLDLTLAKYRMRKKSLSKTSLSKLIKYHYELFRLGEGMGSICSFYHTCVNLFFGVFKKIIYHRKDIKVNPSHD